MKNLKIKVFFIAVFLLSLLILPISQGSNNVALGATPSEISTYFTLTTRDGVISNDFISSSVEEVDNKRVTNTFVFVNDTVTIKLKPFNHFYNLNDDEVDDNFCKNVTKIEILKSSTEYQDYIKEPEVNPDNPNSNKEVKSLTFEYYGKTYYFIIFEESKTVYPEDGGTPVITTSEYIKIYETKPASQYSYSIISSNKTNAIIFTNTDDSIIIEITDSYTLTHFKNQTQTSINLPVYRNSESFDMIINFVKIPARFANNEEPVVKFNTYKNLDPITMEYAYAEEDFWLQKEQSFTKIDLTFLTDIYTYSEIHPLYFKLNFNGFVYDYTLYSLNGNLYVKYVDELKYNKATTAEEKEEAIFQLATKSDLSTIVPANKSFSMSFTYRGRYSFEVYDDTYIHGIKNPNYYSTSFYIKNDSSSKDEYISSAQNNTEFMKLFGTAHPDSTPTKIAQTYESFYNSFTRNPSNKAITDLINKNIRIDVALNVEEFTNAFNRKYPDATLDELDELYFSFYDEFVSDLYNNRDAIRSIEERVSTLKPIVFIEEAKKNLIFMSEFESMYPNLTDAKVEKLYNDFYDLFLSDEQYTSLENYQQIVDDIEYETKSALLFNNIYILSEITDDAGTPIEYIVNNSTLNNSVVTTIKNLSNFDVENFTLPDVISRVDVIYTQFGDKDNIVTRTSHYTDEILSYLAQNGEDYKLSFDSDGYYQVRVYNRLGTSRIDYNFTIVKNAKANYTIDGVTHEATREFYTEIINYSKNINNSDPIRFLVSTGDIANQSESVLNITYQNKYRIIYGIQKVDIKFSKNEDATILYISCLGVGDLTVTVTVNGKTTTHYLNSEKGRGTISTGEYGTYTIKVVDNMGTTGSAAFKFTKKMNTSSLIFIGIVVFLVAVIVLFFFSVRGRLKTR